MKEETKEIDPKDFTITDHQMDCKWMHYAMLKSSLMYAEKFYKEEIEQRRNYFSALNKAGERTKGMQGVIKSKEINYTRSLQQMNNIIGRFEIELHQIGEEAQLNFDGFFGFVHNINNKLMLCPDKAGAMQLIDLHLNGMLDDVMDNINNSMKKLADDGLIGKEEEE